MWVAVVLVICSVFLVKWGFRVSDRGDLDRIPRPKDPRTSTLSKIHVAFHALTRKYGPIFLVKYGGEPTVVVSDFDLIYKVMVQEGTKFGGRINNFRMKHLFSNSGIIFNQKPDAKWKLLRKLSQRHLRQFGDGMTRLESIISSVADEMFEDFTCNLGIPYDPQNAIISTALNSIAFLITGERLTSGDPIIAKMRENERLVFKTIQVFAPKTFQLLETFPWLWYFGFARWPVFQRCLQLNDEIWREVKWINASNPESESICKVLMKHLTQKTDSLSEEDAKMVSLSLLLAGVITTAITFYAAVNILAHHRTIQDKLFEEVMNTKQQEGSISLLTRHKMPYCTAFILELLRYATVLPNGVTHLNPETAELGGFLLPAGTQIVTNLWSLHHDETFWVEPYKFRPERFLDDKGEIVPADHPHRTHLMPFGAGTRVCLGESLAMARIFIWLTNFIERFEISPAPGNDKSSVDARNYDFEGVLRPRRYCVVLGHRA